ncbi:MAG: AAA family ATPase [Candidatus Gracilibacteria bacterium]
MYPQIPSSLIPEIVVESFQSQSKTPLFFWGLRGCGKTTNVKRAALSLNVNCIIVNLQQIEPTDLIGLPNIKDNKTIYSLPPLLPTKEKQPEWRGIIFFDEFSEAPPTCKSVLLSILAERRFGIWHLPDDALIVAASNIPEEGTLWGELALPLLSRFEHYSVTPSVEDFLNSENIHPAVAKYLRKYPEDLYGDMPCPRTWSRVSDLLYQNSKLLETRIQANLGLEIGLKFISFLKVDFPSPKEVLDGNIIMEKNIDWLPVLKNWAEDEELDLQKVNQASLAIYKLVSLGEIPREAAIHYGGLLVKNYLHLYDEAPNCEGIEKLKELKEV